jgi:hypothetical protein
LKTEQNIIDEKMTEKIVFIIFFFESTQKLEVEISQKERK